MDALDRRPCAGGEQRTEDRGHPGDRLRDPELARRPAEHVLDEEDLHGVDGLEGDDEGQDRRGQDGEHGVSAERGHPVERHQGAQQPTPNHSSAGRAVGTQQEPRHEQRDEGPPR